VANLLEYAIAPPGTDSKLAKMYLVPLDANTGEPLAAPGGGGGGAGIGGKIVDAVSSAAGGDAPSPADLPSIELQYWPETVTYNRGTIGWQQRDVPGLSHSLFQWTGNGSPSLSFEAVFTSDHDPGYQPLLTISDGSDSPFIRDLDLNEVAAWFAAATNPMYGEGENEPVNPPPIIQVIPESIAPSMELAGTLDALGAPPAAAAIAGALEDDAVFNLGSGGSNSVGTQFSQIDRDFFAILKDFSIVYEKWWPSGAPRIIRVALTFMETIQLGGQILPHSRERNLKVFKTHRLIGTVG